MHEQPSQTVLITGGTGMIGRALTRALLEGNYQVIILTRQVDMQKTGEGPGGLSYASWDPPGKEIDREAIARADYIIHLAGANVGAKRWTARRKKQIADSRVETGKLLANVLSTSPNKVKAVISASAIGWYGPDPEVPNPKPFSEEDPPSNDFLGLTCQEWEAAIEPVTSLGIRLVKFRTGYVLGNTGGMFVEFKKPVRFGLATILGSGKQMVSWIHLHDLVQLYLSAIRNETMQGAYNAVAPFPVSNKSLVLTLARQLKGSFFIPFYVPAFLLKWILGEMSIEVLKSATVSANRVRETGFTFAYPGIESAINRLLTAPDQSV